jgi:hypothetical protein
VTTYAPNYTPRYRAHYTAAGISHTIQVRAERTEDIGTGAGLAAPLAGLFSTFASQLAVDFAWTGAEYALVDSDDFIPTATPGAVVGTRDISEFSLKARATSTNFNGRATGSRAALYMYGVLWLDGLGEAADNGRVTPAESAFVTTAAGICSANFAANSGTPAIWHDYANIKLNDHLLKLLRRGTIS